MKGNISDHFLIEVAQEIADRKLDPPSWNVYIFEVAGRGGGIVGICAANQEDAEKVLMDRGRRPIDLLRVDVQTYGGLTYAEVMQEIKNRKLVQ